MSEERSANDRTARLIAFFLPVAFLLPFINKAYHADDLLFVWVTEQIMRAPLDFYGFMIDYGYARTPIYQVFHNPPGVSLSLALFGWIFGGGEVVYHVAMLASAGVAGLGTYLLARDLVSAPLIVTCVGILTPAFLVSGSTLMSDLPVMAAYVWAVYFWRRGMRSERGWELLIASLVIAAGILLKYYAITLVPLLLVYGLLVSGKMGRWAFYLLIPIGTLVAFQGFTLVLYGTTTLTDAAGIALASSWRTEETMMTRPILTLAFVGGCFLPLAFLVRFSDSWRLLAGLGGVVVLLLVPIAEGFSALQLMLGGSEPYGWPGLLWMGVLVWLGAGLLVVALRECSRQGDADAALLVLWLFGTLLFSAAINHFINARALLPLLPALTILVGRSWSDRTPRAWILVPAALLTLWTLIGDYEVADHGRRAAVESLTQAEAEGVQLYHVAFWGSEYYLLAAGSKGFAFDDPEKHDGVAVPLVNPGELVFVHSLGATGWDPPPRGFEIVKEMSYRYRGRLTTFDAAADAGFYSHRNGYFPFVVGHIAPERFLLLRWNGPQDGSEADE